MNPQQSIAHYRITAKLGEGGMGTVYRATDTKLNREVAIKILPDALAADPDYLARFTREARVLASLNHPHIAAIYGIEDRAIVMELVEGRDLPTPLPLEEALPIARQIVEALEAAHEKGVVHRDLKPANIKLTPEGKVKVLDFGLAKAVDPATASTPNSPTLTLRATQAGVIMGTASYMAPEQARGKIVDKRADIWAFGVVLYELLTGRQLFGGDTVTDILASIVKDAPDLNALPADTPANVRRLLERCLRKDPSKRLRDIGEARLALDEPAELPVRAAPAASARGSWLPWTVAAIAVGVLAFVSLRGKPPAAPSLFARFVLPLPDGFVDPLALAVPQTVPSPDGRHIVFVAVDSKGTSSLFIRPIGATSAHRLDKTEGATVPFWSSDSQYIAFFADQRLKKIAVSGGSLQTLCESSSRATSTGGDGGTWNREGVIVFSPGPGGPLLRVSAAGGVPTPVTSFKEGNDVRHSWPQFLPDGRHFLYFAASLNERSIYVQELGSTKRVLVTRNDTRAMWAPPGYLLFVREGTLSAQRMDTATFQLSGDSIPLAEDVSANTANARSSFAVSESGVLVFRRGGSFAQRQLVWYDRAGKRLRQIGPMGEFSNIVLAPDEKRAAVISRVKGQIDVWIVDLVSGVLSPLTHGGKASLNIGPWSPDSQRLAFNLAAGGIEELTVAGGPSKVLAPDSLEADSWSPDGRSLLCVAISQSRQILLLPLDVLKPQKLVAASYRNAGLRFSPDGKFVAYDSGESGRQEVYVASFPDFAHNRQISKDGGGYAAWSGDGKEIFYRQPAKTLMAVAIQTGAEIEAGIPRPLFEYGEMGPGNRFAVSADGRQFLLMDYVQKADLASESVVVVNWAAELKP